MKPEIYEERLNFKIDKKLVRELKKTAKTYNKTMSEIIRSAITYYLARKG